MPNYEPYMACYSDMASIEDVPKLDEVMEKKEIDERSDVPAEPKNEVADNSSAKSPSKSPMKTPSTSSAKSPKKSQPKPSEKSPKKPVEEKTSSPTKSAKSSPKKAKKEESEEEDEEDEDEEQEEKIGILDMPLVIEGKRKRESTSFLKVEEKMGTKHKAPTTAGSGTALEDIPFILHQIESEKKVEDLRPIYHVCFGTKGKHSLLRREVKKFNGFSFAKDSEEYKKKHGTMLKHTKSDISHMRRILGLTSGKTKEEEVQIVLDFLLKPHDEGKKIPKKAVKRKTAGKGKTPGKKAKKESASTKTSKEDTESDEDEKSSESGEEEEKEVKQTPKKTPAKRKAAAEQKTKTPSKKAKKAESEEDEEEKKDDHSVTSSSDSSEKKEEKMELVPSDKEVKAKISELLKTFDLTSVSMKQMVLAVCEAFPEHPQLHERTASIKAFIKDAIRDEE